MVRKALHDAGCACALIFRADILHNFSSAFFVVRASAKQRYLSTSRTSVLLSPAPPRVLVTCLVVVSARVYTPTIFLAVPCCPPCSPLQGNTLPPLHALLAADKARKAAWSAQLLPHTSELSHLLVGGDSHVIPAKAVALSRCRESGVSGGAVQEPLHLPCFCCAGRQV